MKMAWKAKKDATAPPKDEAKTKALKTKKAVLKDVHSHKKKIHITRPLMVQDTVAPRAAKYPKSTPRRNKLEHYAIIKFPWLLSQPWRR